MYFHFHNNIGLLLEWPVHRPHVWQIRWSTNSNSNDHTKRIKDCQEKMAGEVPTTSWRQLSGMKLFFHECKHVGNRPFAIGFGWVFCYRVVSIHAWNVEWSNRDLDQCCHRLSRKTTYDVETKKSWLVIFAHIYLISFVTESIIILPSFDNSGPTTKHKHMHTRRWPTDTHF